VTKSDPHGRENLAPKWEKGQSGNPAGRPKEKLLTDAIRVRLKYTVGQFLTKEEVAKYGFSAEQQKLTVAELLADRFIRAALAGNSEGTRQFRELMDRIEGRVPLPLMGVEGGEFVLNVVNHIARPNRVPKPEQKTSKKPAKNLQ
jgi:hypothetical protein